MEKQEYEKSVLEYEDVKDAMEYHHRMGKAEGFNEGYERGMEEGVERGIKKGQEDAKRQLVACMIERGMPMTDIASITGITEDEVRRLVE